MKKFISSIMTLACNSNRHKFEARYDEQPNLGFKKLKAGITGSGIRNLMYYKIYVCDICIRCGEKIIRESK